MKEMRRCMKFGTVALIAVAFAIGLSSCLDKVEYPLDFYHRILIKNNLDMSVVIAIVPRNITLEELDREAYSSITVIEPNETGNCQYYVSFYGYYFSVSEEMEVIVVDSTVFSTYKIENIIWSTDKQLCRCTLDKGQLLLSDAVGRIDMQDNEVKLIFGY